MEQQYLSTATLASRLDIKAASIRTALSRRGHLWGMRPLKAPGGRLLWSAHDVAQLIERLAQDNGVPARRS